ncbi:MAG: isochorismatase family cysteine hydrolase [Minisyncoccales bacterium]
MANVILVVDMLKGFYNIGNLANPRMANIIPNVVELLEKKNGENDTVILLGDVHEKDDKEFQMFPPHCIGGTEETDAIDELADIGKIYIPKSRFSGFFNTGLKLILESLNPGQVIVVGVCTDICILHTVADLRNRDYKVIVPRDCVETFDSPEHPADQHNQWALNHMQYILGAIVIDHIK